MADHLNKEALEEIGIQNCDTVIVCIGENITVSPEYRFKEGDIIVVIGKIENIWEFERHLE